MHPVTAKIVCADCVCSTPEGESDPINVGRTS